MAGGKDIHEVTNEAVGRVIARTERDIIRAYSEMIRRVLKKLPLVNMGFIKGDGKTWEDLRKHPMFRKALHEEVERMTERWKRATREGIGRGWWMGERESDAIVDGYFAGRSVPRGLRNSYKHRNDKALQAFLKRGGGFYSRRVWQDGERVERHLCDSIAEGLSEGMSAQKLSRKIREDLRYPDKLFRRVRNKYGELVLSKNAREFHPGQGVYRSSYKNAMRLARTEINTAYRTADHERWQELDFVKGIRVSLSNNHTCNGVPFRDICDDLQGVYPKGFKFTGWHPQCRCMATPIMEDFEEFLKRKINGGEARKGVEEVPKNFKEWVRNNGARIEEAGERGKLPYFLNDNKELWINTHQNERITKLLDGKEPPIKHTKQEIVVADPKRFRRAIAKEKIRNKNGWMVDVHDDYSEEKCFLTKDGKAGVAVTKDGDIVSLFSSVGGDHRSEKLIMMAIENGGCKCDCYGGGLENIYRKFGAEAVGRVKFNREYAPDAWKLLPDGDPRKKEYDVVAMIFPKSVKESVDLWKSLDTIKLSEVKLFGDYDEMIKFRDSLLD